VVRDAGRRLVWCVENPRDTPRDGRLAACRQVRDELLRLIDDELVGA